MFKEFVEVLEIKNLNYSNEADIVIASNLVIWVNRCSGNAFNANTENEHKMIVAIFSKAKISIYANPMNFIRIYLFAFVVVVASSLAKRRLYNDILLGFMLIRLTFVLRMIRNEKSHRVKAFDEDASSLKVFGCLLDRLETKTVLFVIFSKFPFDWNIKILLLQIENKFKISPSSINNIYRKNKKG